MGKHGLDAAWLNPRYCELSRPDEDQKGSGEYRDRDELVGASYSDISGNPLHETFRLAIFPEGAVRSLNFDQVFGCTVVSKRGGEVVVYRPLAGAGTA